MSSLKPLGSFLRQENNRTSPNFRVRFTKHAEAGLQSWLRGLRRCHTLQTEDRAGDA